MKKLDRYLLWPFIRNLVAVTLTAGVIIIVINLIEELRDFIDHDVPILTILEYYLYFGGWVIKSFFPVFVLLSTLFTVSLLARKNEILAMKAAGVSLYRITAPILVAAIILSAGHFYYNEYIFPPLNMKRLEIKEFTIEKRSRKQYVTASNVYRQISPGYFYTIASFEIERLIGKEVKVYRRENNRLAEIISAPTITYVDFKWLAQGGTVRRFSDSGETYTEFASMALTDIKDKPEDLAQPLGNPQDMGYDQLKSYIDLMKRTGAPFERELVDLGLKVSFPVTSAVVVLISIPFAANPRRSGIVVSFAAGAILALVYFVAFRIMQSAGYNQKIPLEAAVWGINGVFFLFGCVSMLVSRK
jgi:lipopolysaccharide export system permease protein